MNYSILKSGLFFVVAFSLTSFSRPVPMQNVRVTMQYILCKAADDYGGTEELYGKVWALNLAPYKSEKAAREYFERDDQLKIGLGGGEIWNKNRNHLVVLSKGQSRQINRSIDISCPETGNIIILGDMNERDYKGDPDDKLASNGSVENKVVALTSFTNTCLVDLVFQSGGTDVWVRVKLEKIN